MIVITFHEVKLEIMTSNGIKFRILALRLKLTVDCRINVKNIYFYDSKFLK